MRTDPMNMKWCRGSLCKGKLRPHTEFYKDKVHGLDNECKECARARRRECWKNRHEIKERKKKQQEAKLFIHDHYAGPQRECKKCGVSQPLTNDFFRQWHSNKGGFHYEGTLHVCRKCESAKTKNRRAGFELFDEHEYEDWHVGIKNSGWKKDRLQKQIIKT